MRSVHAISLSFFLLAAAYFTAAAKEPDQVVGTPVRVTEWRGHEFDPDDHGRMAHWLGVYVKFEGDAIHNAVAYANVRIDKAIDDVGTNLAGDTGWIRKNSELNLIHHEKEQPATRPSVVIGIAIEPASRSATKIAILKGQFQLLSSGDSTSTIVVAKLKRNISQGMSSPALDKAKLRLQMGVPSGDTGDHLYAYIMGNPAAVRRIWVADEDGKLLAEAKLDPRITLRSRNCSIDLPRVVDDRMSLMIEVAQGQKVLTVPFELKDIPLP